MEVVRSAEVWILCETYQLIPVCTMQKNHLDPEGLLDYGWLAPSHLSDSFV